MKQALHIFRKDMRRFRWLIPLSVAASAALSFSTDLNFPSSVLILFLWAIAVRLIHEEAPVGDRQFWITRPYSWKSLLAAKALFLIVFMIAPRIVADWLALSKKGLGPSEHVPGLFWKAALNACVLLAIVALAAQVKKLAQFLFLIFVLYFGLFIALILLRPLSGPIWPQLDWTQDSAIAVIIFAAAGAALLTQYRGRRAWVARGILLSSVALVLVVYLAFPWTLATALVYRRATSQGASGSVSIALDPDTEKDPRHSWGGSTHAPGTIRVYFPFLVDGIPPDTEISWDQARIQIQSADGTSWDSSWSLDVFPTDVSDGREFIGFAVDRAFFQRNRANSADVRVWLALTLFKKGSTVPVSFSPGTRVVIPGFGVCAYHQDGRDRSLECISALRLPRGRLAVEEDPETLCVEGTPPPDWQKEVSRTITMTNSSGSPYPAGFATVKTFFEYYAGSARREQEADGREWTVKSCTGTVLNLSLQNPIDHVLFETNVRGVILSKYGRSFDSGYSASLE